MVAGNRTEDEAGVCVARTFVVCHAWRKIALEESYPASNLVF